MSPPAYLAYLLQELQRSGVSFHRHLITSLDEAYSLPSVGPVDLVVHALGLGARHLIGVEDKDVYPIRGDTVLVRAKSVDAVYKILDPKTPGEIKDGKRFYIIPRPGNDGMVILGGTELDDDWDTSLREETAERILKDGYAMCPALSGGQGWEKIEVISRNVGLRPARKGGARVELEERVLEGREGDERKVGVVHAYGIGAAGYQASIGLSRDVADLADGYLRSL